MSPRRAARLMRCRRGHFDRTPDNRRGAQYPLLDILDDFGPPRSEKKTVIWAKIAGKSEEKSDIWAQIGRFQERVAQWLSVDKIESDHEFEPASQKSDFKDVDAARGENHEKMRPKIEFLKVDGRFWTNLRSKRPKGRKKCRTKPPKSGQKMSDI